MAAPWLLARTDTRAHDGYVQIPPDLLDALPPGTLARAVRTELGIELQRAQVERDRRA